MYANHVTGTFGQSTVEVHITRREFAGLSYPARDVLIEYGKRIGLHDSPSNKPTRGPNAPMIWHLRQSDALAIEAIIDEAAG